MPVPKSPSLQEALAFVDRVELPRRDDALELADELPQPDFSKEGSDSVTVGSQIASFAAGFPPHLRQPIANGFLLAQLAANRALETRDGGERDWFHVYVNTLGHIGLTDEDTSVTYQEVSGSAVEVRKSIIPVITTLLGGPAIAAATTIVSVLEGLADMNKDSPWITVFDRASQRANTKQFQISHAEMIGGAPVIALASFTLDAKHSVTQVLFFKFTNSKASLDYATKRISVNVDLVETAADRIGARLAEHVLDYIVDLEI